MLKKTAVIIVILVVLACLVAVKPLDYTPLKELPEYAEVMQNLDSISFRTPASNQMLAGWAKVNITPDHPVPLAGYGRRYPQTGVHDSLFVRVMVFDNGNRREAVVTIDLLLFPKALLQKLRNPVILQQLHLDGMYAGSGHTHNGFGAWDHSLAGEMVFGKFDPELFEDLSERTISAIRQASAELQQARIGYKRTAVPELLYNRLDDKEGRVDPWLRVLEVERDDGKKAMLVSYPAHPINIDSEIYDLSRDYPGVLTDRLESNDDIDFAMFMAGMVGSHHLKSNGKKDFDLTNYAGKILAEKILKDTTILWSFTDFALGFHRFDSKLHRSQMRISRHLAIRDWLFRLTLGPLEGQIEVLRVGNVLMIGLPCDFSGEIAVNEQLDSLAESKDLHLIITSFNGDYIGYITDDRYYDTIDKDEVRLMNWTGPYKGKYFGDIIKKIIEKS